MKDGHMIEVKFAPEPTDLNWDNLNISLKAKICSRLLATIIYLVLIIGTAGITFFIIHLEKEDKIGHNFAMYTVIFIVSMIIISFNIIFSVVINVITKWEKHTTFTG